MNYRFYTRAHADKASSGIIDQFKHLYITQLHYKLTVALLVLTIPAALVIET